MDNKEIIIRRKDNPTRSAGNITAAAETIVLEGDNLIVVFIQ